MTHPDASERAREVAVGLTPAQQFVLVEEFAEGPSKLVCHTLVAIALMRKDLVTGRVRGPELASSFFQLTPFGLAVRRILEERP